MKKYVKPELFYEKYELSQHIADCGWEMTSANKESCYAKPDPDKIPNAPNLFLSDTNGCVLIPENEEDYCYTIGAGGATLFAS